MSGYEIAALVVALVGTAAGIQQGSKAAEKADDAAKLENALAEQKRVKDLRVSINNQRIARANQIASGLTQTGTTGTAGGGFSSGLAGGLASQQTQAASEVGFATTTNAAYRGINSANKDRNKYLQNEASFGAVAKGASYFGFPDFTP
jgi:tetrahydromethanopterin S-methyltransferase subunit F